MRSNKLLVLLVLASILVLVACSEDPINCNKAGQIKKEEKISQYQVDKAFKDFRKDIDLLGGKGSGGKIHPMVVSIYNKRLEELRKEFGHESCWGLESYPPLDEGELYFNLENILFFQRDDFAI